MRRYNGYKEEREREREVMDMTGSGRVSMDGTPSEKTRLMGGSIQSLVYKREMQNNAKSGGMINAESGKQGRAKSGLMKKESRKRVVLSTDPVSA